MDASVDQDDENFFDSQSLACQSIRLSHLNNKSSVLCPTSQNITSQYLALQQLDAHQKMVARAKGIVDNFAPQSMQSYISAEHLISVSVSSDNGYFRKINLQVVDQQKKKLWRKSPNQSKSSELKRPVSSTRSQPFLSDEEDNASVNASSVNRAIQAGIPFVSLGSNTDDKITWYLEALRQGELLASPFVYVKDSTKIKERLSSSTSRRALNGDILDTHVNCFAKSKKPFSPRIVADTTIKSKIKEMRCYQPPVRRKKKNSENSSDTFESYYGEEDSEEDAKELEKVFDGPSEDIETQINRKFPSERNLNDRLQEYLIHQNRVTFGSSSKRDGNDESKYLEFLSKVTEHILRSGVYSDQSIQQAFEFHMQFYTKDENKDKLQSLLSQVLEGMKISGSDSDEISFNKSPLSPLLSPPNTPLLKESSGIFQLVTNSAKNEELTEEYPPSLSSQAQNVDDLSNDPHLLSDSGISIRQTDS